MSSEYRVAVLGCGNVGKARHAPAFDAIDGVTIAAACDVREDCAKELAATYGVPAYTDMHKMLANEELDIVDVVTTEKDRIEPLLAAFEAGKHVFCEKPLAGTRGQLSVRWDDVEAAQPVIDAWQKAGTYFGINFNYHTSPPAIQIRQAIDDGTIGKIIGINVSVHLWCWSHAIDLMRWFAGDVAELTAEVAGPENAEHRSAALRFVNGAVGTLMGTMAVGTVHEMLRVEVVGDKCRAVMIDLCGRVEFFPYSLEQREALIWQKPISDWRGGFDRTFDYTIQNYMAAVKAGVQPDVNGINAIRELEIDAGVFVSAESGEPFQPPLYG